ncbi:MAG TPA: helix-hairpin-helix domain-containing protein, partial [Pyrinomonadaceae bacterium]
ENRQMEVIVNEDQLSLAIGKRGQNVRLATKLVGWNIDIRSEEEIKREVTEQMGALIASGESVPLSAIEGVTAQQADALAEHGINDIDALAQTTVDDLVEFLDLSLDEAETILNAAKAVTALRDRSLHGEVEGDEEAIEEATAEGEEAEAIETHAVSAELDESIEAGEVEPSDDMTAQGYDEAVESGVPFRAEPEILAWESADPVAVTEAEPISSDEILLQEPGRDLRPDTITPSPDITSTGVAALDNINQLADDISIDELAASQETASEEPTAEAETSTPATSEDAASGGSSDEEKQ